MRSHVFMPLVLALQVGCSSPPTYGETQSIEPEYSPLEQLSERPDLVLSSTATTTIGHHVYVVDLDKWLVKHPVGSLDYRAVMLHEQEHSRRQLDVGTVKWLGQYLTDPDTMWKEEQRGWYLELRARVAGGQTINPLAVADTLHEYKTLTGQHMVSRGDALVWCQAVLNGTWTPGP